jgi:hypothetical protein
LGQSCVEFRMLLPQIVHLVDIQVVDGNRGPAPSVCINSIVHQE